MSFRYKGQAGYITDTDTDLIYCQHRVYDPKAGRWLTRDPIGVDGGINSYEYCDGDPVNNIDPSGLDTQTQLFAHICHDPCPLAVKHNEAWLLSHLGDPLGAYGRVPRTPPNYHLGVWVARAKAIAKQASSAYYDPPFGSDETFFSSPASAAVAVIEPWFFHLVKPGGPMDFKKNDRYRGGFDAHFQEIVDYGNFNYGVMGKALGYGDDYLLVMGGVAAIASNAKNGKFSAESDVFGAFHGDQPRDQFFIRMGLKYYDAHYSR